MTESFVAMACFCQALGYISIEAIEYSATATGAILFIDNFTLEFILANIVFDVKLLLVAELVGVDPVPSMDTQTVNDNITAVITGPFISALNLKFEFLLDQFPAYIKVSTENLKLTSFDQ